MAGSDKKPKACAGPVMKRTDSHVLANNKINVTRSGDSHARGPMFNIAETTFPDSDPRWGLTPCDDDFPE